MHTSRLTPFQAPLSQSNLFALFGKVVFESPSGGATSGVSMNLVNGVKVYISLPSPPFFSFPFLSFRFLPWGSWAKPQRIGVRGVTP